MIIDYLILLHNIMKAEKGTPEYWRLVKKLPTEWQDSYNVLCQWGCQFIIMSSTGKRAREGKINTCKIGRIKYLRFLEKIYPLRFMV